MGQSLLRAEFETVSENRNCDLDHSRDAPAILLAEDDPVTRMLMTRFLKKAVTKWTPWPMAPRPSIR